MIDELIEKWQDVHDSSDDFTERTIADEIIHDLKELKRFYG